MHEIAHALTPGHSHDVYWKSKAKQLGAVPKSKSKQAIMPKGKRVYKCPNCSKTTHKHRRLRRDLSCGTCCRKYNNGRYSSKYMLELIE